MSIREKLIAETDYSSVSALVIFEAMAEETSVSPLRHGRWRKAQLGRPQYANNIAVGTRGGGFPNRRSKFRGELALILEDLFSLAVEEQKGSSGNGLQDRCSCRSLLLRWRRPIRKLLRLCHASVLV